MAQLLRKVKIYCPKCGHVHTVDIVAKSRLYVVQRFSTASKPRDQKNFWHAKRDETKTRRKKK